MSATTTTENDSKLLQDVIRQGRIADAARRQADLDNTEARESEKKAKEEAKRLIKLTLALSEGPGPLYGQNGSGGPSKPPATSAEDSSWRSVKLEELPGLTDHLVANLHAAEIDTMGELCDYKALDKPAKIHGVGKAAWDKIDDAVEKFFENRKKVAQLVGDVANGTVPGAKPVASAPDQPGDLPASPPPTSPDAAAPAEASGEAEALSPAIKCPCGFVWYRAEHQVCPECGEDPDDVEDPRDQVLDGALTEGNPTHGELEQAHAADQAQEEQAKEKKKRKRRGKK